MLNDNSQKKKQIDATLAKYNTRMSALKQKRDKIVSNFLEVLKEKKLAQLRDQLKSLWNRPRALRRHKQK